MKELDFKKVLHGEFPSPSREDFGEGEAGQRAYNWIVVYGVTCEGIIEGDIKCGDPAYLTLDFDIPRINALEQIPVCHKHLSVVKQKIRSDFKAEDSLTDPSFGINGRGRS